VNNNAMALAHRDWEIPFQVTVAIKFFEDREETQASEESEIYKVTIVTHREHGRPVCGNCVV